MLALSEKAEHSHWNLTLLFRVQGDTDLSLGSLIEYLRNFHLKVS
jgi:hypothetical protein